MAENDAAFDKSDATFNAMLADREAKARADLCAYATRMETLLEWALDGVAEECMPYWREKVEIHLGRDR